MDQCLEFLKYVVDHPLESVLLAIILFFASLLSYKRMKWLQKVINVFVNLICLKRNNVIYYVRDVKHCNIYNITSKYSEEGYKLFKPHYKNYKKETINDINDHNDKKIILHDYLEERLKQIRKAKERGKKEDSFIYLGFSHIPFSFLDGHCFSNAGKVKLYEYNDKRLEFQSEGYFELHQVYNSSIELENNLSSFAELDKEIAVKIVLTYEINDDDIGEIQPFNQIVSLRPSEKILNYAQIYKLQKEFKNILDQLQNFGVQKIHLFSTTPNSLTFSLGRVIEHSHPEVIAYNYTKGKFDWSISVQNKEIVQVHK